MLSGNNISESQKQTFGLSEGLKSRPNKYNCDGVKIKMQILKSPKPLDIFPS